MANIDVFEREDISSTCARTRASSARMLESLRDIPIVGDVRGAGYFHAIELVKDRDDRRRASTDEESETLLRGFLSGELFQRGLICRADDRGDPVIQLSPPLIAGPRSSTEIEAVLRPVLEEATERMNVGALASEAPMLTVRELVASSTSALLRVRPGSTRRCAGCTSPSCAIRRPGCRAASCC